VGQIKVIKQLGAFEATFLGAVLGQFSYFGVYMGSSETYPLRAWGMMLAFAAIPYALAFSGQRLVSSFALMCGFTAFVLIGWLSNTFWSIDALCAQLPMIVFGWIGFAGVGVPKLPIVRRWVER
jgi:hypothetical protein